MRLSLSHIAEGEWRAMFMEDNGLLAPRGFCVASAPWRAVQRAAWAMLPKEDSRWRGSPNPTTGRTAA
jgi:hypothetical protein